ncbi:hypothetical protein [Shewanella waksmanii]|uniref:hypothetical protein n=1 Tax=Shewanella waksmanii TaxID=213783 RepID=UPI003736F60F
MMEFVTYPEIGVAGEGCKGILFYCQFGHKYLICHPVDKPEDPFLPLPRMDVWCTPSYGRQLLSLRHPWRNDASVLAQLVSYLSGERLANQLDEYDMITHLAIAMQQRQLLVFPLEND